jgi:hypothetical protein
VVTPSDGKDCKALPIAQHFFYNASTGAILLITNCLGSKGSKIVAIDCCSPICDAAKCGAQPHPEPVEVEGFTSTDSVQFKKWKNVIFDLSHGAGQASVQIKLRKSGKCLVAPAKPGDVVLDACESKGSWWKTEEVGGGAFVLGTASGACAAVDPAKRVKSRGGTPAIKTDDAVQSRFGKAATARINAQLSGPRTSNLPNMESKPRSANPVALKYLGGVQYESTNEAFQRSLPDARCYPLCRLTADDLIVGEHAIINSLIWIVNPVNNATDFERGFQLYEDVKNRSGDRLHVFWSMYWSRQYEGTDDPVTHRPRPLVPLRYLNDMNTTMHWFIRMYHAYQTSGRFKSFFADHPRGPHGAFYLGDPMYNDAFIWTADRRSDGSKRDIRAYSRHALENNVPNVWGRLVKTFWPQCVTVFTIGGAYNELGSIFGVSKLVGSWRYVDIIVTDDYLVDADALIRNLTREVLPRLASHQTFALYTQTGADHAPSYWSSDYRKLEAYYAWMQRTPRVQGIFAYSIKPFTPAQDLNASSVARVPSYSFANWSACNTVVKCGYSRGLVNARFPDGVFKFRQFFGTHVRELKPPKSNDPTIQDRPDEIVPHKTDEAPRAASWRGPRVRIVRGQGLPSLALTDAQNVTTLIPALWLTGSTPGEYAPPEFSDKAYKLRRELVQASAAGLRVISTELGCGKCCIMSSNASVLQRRRGHKSKMHPLLSRSDAPDPGPEILPDGTLSAKAMAFLRGLMIEAPQMYLLPRLRLDCRQGWMNPLYPGLHTLPGIDPTKVLLQHAFNSSLVIQDNTSSPTRAWAEWVGNTTAKVMAQIDREFPGRVIGAQLIHGVSSEGNYPADWSSHMEGFKVPNAFYNYWADHSLGTASDFCRQQSPPPTQCVIPSAMERNRPTRGSTLVTADTTTGAAVVDYNRFINVQMASGIASVGAALKRVSGGRAFTTTLYGGNQYNQPPCMYTLVYFGNIVLFWLYCRYLQRRGVCDRWW